MNWMKRILFACTDEPYLACTDEPVFACTDDPPTLSCKASGSVAAARCSRMTTRCTAHGERC